MNFAFLQISVPSSSFIKKIWLVPSSEGISWMILPVMSHMLSYELQILTLSPSLESTFHVCFAMSTFVCLSCLVLSIFVLSFFVIGNSSGFLCVGFLGSVLFELSLLGTSCGVLLSFLRMSEPVFLLFRDPCLGLCLSLFCQLWLLWFCLAVCLDWILYRLCWYLCQFFFS